MKLLDDNLSNIGADKVQQSSEKMKVLEEKVAKLEASLEVTVKIQKKTIADTAPSQPKKVLDKKSCKECGEMFLRNHEFENHTMGWREQISVRFAAKHSKGSGGLRST